MKNSTYSINNHKVCVKIHSRGHREENEKSITSVNSVKEILIFPSENDLL